MVSKVREKNRENLIHWKYKYEHVRERNAYVAANILLEDHQNIIVF